MESRLIDGLLDLTRMTRGKLQLKCEVLDGHELVERALATAAQEGSVAGPAIRRQLEATQSMIYVDPTRMQQVCWNIIKNALQYTPGDGTLTIKSRNPDDRTLELRFVDTGAGIESEFLPRVFEAFERGPNMGHLRPGGLGLGMAIARSLIQQLGGSIHAASAGAGKGSTFTVQVPLAGPAQPSAPARVASATSESDTATAPLRILLVEDDAATRQVITDMLRAVGHEVATAATIKQALAAAEAGTFDLLLSDIGLPDGSGLDVMRWFSQHRPIPGIAVSGYGTDEYLRRSLEAGFVTHLVKPIPASTLRWAIRQATELDALTPQ
jgi:CheY-like chemotaxis protein